MSKRNYHVWRQNSSEYQLLGGKNRRRHWSLFHACIGRPLCETGCWTYFHRLNRSMRNLIGLSCWSLIEINNKLLWRQCWKYMPCCFPCFCWGQTRCGWRITYVWIWVWYFHVWSVYVWGEVHEGRELNSAPFFVLPHDALVLSPFSSSLVATLESSQLDKKSNESCGTQWVKEWGGDFILHTRSIFVKIKKLTIYNVR